MRKNKKGTTTLFLAIILSALIIVETTYVAFVADLDNVQLFPEYKSIDIIDLIAK